jgi:hypothetical protein
MGVGVWTRRNGLRAWVRLLSMAQQALSSESFCIFVRRPWSVQARQIARFEMERLTFLQGAQSF